VCNRGQGFVRTKREPHAFYKGVQESGGEGQGIQISKQFAVELLVKNNKC
jgi:hypothetical protein